MYRYDVHAFALGHILYPGHRLVVRVHTPPLADGRWGYDPRRQPGVNRLYRSPDHPSSVLVPTVPWPDDQQLPAEPECGEPAGYRCLRYEDRGDDGGPA